MTRLVSSRREQIAAFYAQHASRLRRTVASDINAPSELIEDACQTAWTILLRRDDVPLDKHGFAWLCKVARTTGYRRAASREQPAGAFLPAAGQPDPRELAEPASDMLDPAEQAIDRERYQQQRQQLLRLTARERRFLALQGLGLSYQEIAEREQASLRTVEKQILRARRKLRQQP